MLAHGLTDGIPLSCQCVLLDVLVGKAATIGGHDCSIGLDCANPGGVPALGLVYRKKLERIPGVLFRPFVP